MISAAVIALVAAWAVGRVATDRWWWSQYAWWLPTVLVTPTGLAGLVLAAVIGRLGPRPGSEGSRAPSNPVFSTALIGVAATVAVLLGIDWRAWGAINPPAQAASALRIVAWNPSQWNQKLAPTCIDSLTDVAVIANPSMTVRWQAWRDSLAGPGADARSISFLRFGDIAVLSKPRILRWGCVPYISRGRPEDATKGPHNPLGQPVRPDMTEREGTVMFIEIDCKAQLGQTAVVWIVDLPSDPRVHKQLIIDEALAYARAWTGPEMIRQPDGTDRSAAPAPGGFPAPDILVGDCNIPRGSWSLTRLAPAMHHAFDDAGASLGPFGAASFPRRWPLWHLDNTLLAPGLRAVRYDLIDPGEGRHRVQLVDVAPRTAR